VRISSDFPGSCRDPIEIFFSHVCASDSTGPAWRASPARNRLPGFRDLRLLESGHARALILSHLMGVAHVQTTDAKAFVIRNTGDPANSREH